MALFKIDVYSDDDLIKTVYQEADDDDHARELAEENLNIDFDIEEVGVSV